MKNLALSAAILLTASPLFPQNIFTPSPGAPFDAGPGPYPSATADFNHDGIPDLAYFDQGGSGVTVLLGDGQGGFAPAPGSPFRGGLEANGLVVADFNGDGNLDLGVESSLAGPNHIGQGSIVVLLGDGKGGFTQYSGANLALTGAGNAGSPAVGDFNGDGIPDIAISGTEGLVIFLGDGQGGFVRGASPSGRGAVSGHIAAGNFTGNGNSDVVVVNSQGLTVFVCDGKGGFTALPIAAIPGAGALVAADFNGDGIPDLAIGEKTTDILLGDGKGGFALRASPPYSGYGFGAPISVADFNGDGNADLAVYDGTQLNILLGDGTGGFGFAQAVVSSGGPFALAGDFNGDGKPDIATPEGTVWVNALKTLTVNPRRIAFQAGEGQTGPNPVSLAAPKVPGLVASSSATWLSYANGMLGAQSQGLKHGVYRGAVRFAAPGYFGTATQVELDVAAASGRLLEGKFFPLASPCQSYFGDFNGDGHPDFLADCNNVLTVWLGDGTGRFSSLQQQIILKNPGMIEIGDFNGDGRLDIAVVAAAAAQVQVLLGDGAGGFVNGPVTAAAFPASAFSSVVADFNRDGFLDIAVPGLLLLGNGQGGFGASPKAFPNAEVYRMAAGDFNGDGFPDLAFTQFASSFLWIYLGDGKGGFTPSQRIDFGQADLLPSQILVGDWNHDGALDLALTNDQNANDLTILLGDGRGFFTKRADVAVSASGRVTSIASGDLDGDGNLDLAAAAAAGASGSGVFVLLGNGQGDFAPIAPGPLTVSANQQVAVLDIDGDGRADIGASGDNGVSILGGSLAFPTISLTEAPPNPFDVGQNVYLNVRVMPDTLAFTRRPITGNVELLDGSTAVSLVPLAALPAYFITPFVPATHKFTAKYLGDNRNAPSSAALTVIENGPPAAISPVGSGFPLRALVTDANNNPIPGVRVTFTAPSSGPGGLFGANTTVAVLTDLKGIATAPEFTPNGLSGGFTVTATTTIGGISCVFPLANP